MSEPTLEERDQMRRAIGAVLFNAMNFPEKVQVHILGQNMGPLNEKLTNAVLDAGFRLTDAAHDAQVLRDAADRIHAIHGGTSRASEYHHDYAERLQDEAARMAGGTSDA